MDAHANASSSKRDAEHGIQSAPMVVFVQLVPIHSRHTCSLHTYISRHSRLTKNVSFWHSADFRPALALLLLSTNSSTSHMRPQSTGRIRQPTRNATHSCTCKCHRRLHIWTRLRPLHHHLTIPLHMNAFIPDRIYSRVHAALHGPHALSSLSRLSTSPIAIESLCLWLKLTCTPSI